MADITQLYAALQKADAAGDTAGAKQLADYIRTQSAPKIAAPAIDRSQELLDSMSGPDKFFAGVGKGMTDVVRGVGQLSRNVLPTGVAYAIGAPTQADIDNSKANDAPLMSTGVGRAGDVTGTVAATLPAAFIPGANTLAGASAVGAGLGLAQPVATGDSRLTNTAVGAAGGLGGAIVGKAAGAVWNGAKALAAPFTESGREAIAARTLDTFGVKPQDLANVTNAPTITGAQPTLAEQLTRPEAATGAARLADSLSSADPKIAAQLAARQGQNNAARVATLQDLAGSAGQRDAAISARSAAADQLYGQARAEGDGVKVDLDDIMERPAIKAAIADAQQTAANFGEKVNLANPVSLLHYAKMNLDGKISAATRAGDNTEVRALSSARDALLSRIEEISPTYGKASQAYAQMSKPINQMDIAQTVLDKGTANTTDLSGNARIMPNSITGAVGDERGLIKTATGRNGTKLADFLNPDQLSKIQAVAGESDRLAAVQREGNGSGSATAQRLATQNILSQLGVPKVLASDGSFLSELAGKANKWVYGESAEPKIRQTIADMILNPEKAQEALKTATPQQRTKLSLLLRQAVRGSAPATALDYASN